MGYLLWFGIVALAFVLMHFFTELDARRKSVITLALTLIVAGAVAYNIRSDALRAHVTDIELRYRHGQSLHCGDTEVNATNFSYSDGTQSFVGNKGTPFEQQIFSSRECR